MKVQMRTLNMRMIVANKGEGPHYLTGLPLFFEGYGVGAKLAPVISLAVFSFDVLMASLNT